MVYKLIIKEISIEYQDDNWYYDETLSYNYSVIAHFNSYSNALETKEILDREGNYDEWSSPYQIEAEHTFNSAEDFLLWRKFQEENKQKLKEKKQKQSRKAFRTQKRKDSKSLSK